MLSGKRIAVYARYSTDKQNPRSVEDQVRACTERVVALGGTVAEVFSDAALSGSSTDRPGLQALYEAAKRRTYDVVVVEDLSRVGRDASDNLLALKRLRSWGARLIALDGFDTDQRQSKLVGALKSAMAEEYIDELKLRTARGMMSLATAGMHTGGKVYGYRSASIADGSTRKRLTVHEPEALIVQRIFGEYVAGHTQHAIAERLNASGIPSPRGGKWGHLTVRAMLTNELYAGVVIYNRREWSRSADTGKRTKKERDRSEWKRTEAPELRIIDAETWDAARARVKVVAAKFKSGKRERRGYPLSGLLACGACGSPMVIGGGGLYYQCSGHRKGHGCAAKGAMREADARAWIMDQIQAVAGEARSLEAMRAEWASSLGSHDREIKAELTERRGALSRTEKQISNLLDRVADGDSSPDVNAKLKEKYDHADLQRGAIARLERELGKVPHIPSTERMRAFLKALPAMLLTEPVETRAFLSELFEGPAQCTVNGPRTAQIRFSIRPDALVNATSADPVRGRRSLGLVAGAGFVLKRAPLDVVGICPRGYARRACK